LNDISFGKYSAFWVVRAPQLVGVYICFWFESVCFC
jgi:hypothetical protein